MLDNIGTFQYVGLDSETLCTELSHICDVGQINDVTEIRDGVNTTAILHTETGEYFIKLHTFNTDEQVFHAQPFILQYFVDEEVPFHTATPIAYDYTQSALPHDWYLTEAIDGETFDTEANDITREKAEQVGQVLGHINSIQTDGFGYSTPPEIETEACDIEGELPFRGESWNEEFKEATLELLNTMDSRFSDLYTPLSDFIKEVELREPTPHLLHFDYWWENILWTDDEFHNNEKPYIIDWERAVGGDPLANRYLSEHYLFDTVAIESERLGDEYYSDDRAYLRSVFRSAYESSYSGTEPLTADSETERMYELLIYIRELRGFPYWWRNKTASWRDERAKALRDGISRLLG